MIFKICLRRRLIVGTKISIDTALFKERVNFIRNAINSVDSEISTGKTFEITNVKPLTEDLENLIETIEMLETYKAHFNEDVDTLDHVGEAIQKQDETLAQPSAQAIHDPRGYTPLST